nr:MAG TPA: hypothetical protein [Caudoviricetes sp.]
MSGYKDNIKYFYLLVLSSVPLLNLLLIKHLMNDNKLILIIYHLLISFQ